MPVFRIDKDTWGFPSPHLADESGLLAIGADFDPRRMLLAYSMGIFPWSEYAGEPLWYSPDPRLVLLPGALHVGRSLDKILRRGDYEVRLDTAFSDVVAACGEVPRPGQDGTWISTRYTDSVRRLHELGLAHSAETWRDGELVGGLYGLSLGRAFFGESMFARADNASKVAFVTLVRQLGRWGFELVDCQVETAHLMRFGAENWSRERFLAALERALQGPTRQGRWSLDPD